MGDIWGVLFDFDGFLVEGFGWNLFFVWDGVLLLFELCNILFGVS